MRILFDHQIFTTQKFGGISRYYYEILNRFYREGKPEFKLSLEMSDNYYLKEAPFFQPSPKAQTSAAFRINSGKLQADMAGGRFDLFHPTYYDPYFLSVIGKTPFVLTVHDMIHENHPGYFSPTDPTRSQKKKLIQLARGIVCVSENTRLEMLERYPEAESKTRVIPHGSSVALGNNEPSPADLSRWTQGRPFLLFLGVRFGYKNFGRMIRGIAPLLRSHPEWRVVCAGGGSFNALELLSFQTLGIHRQIVDINPLKDEVLKELYRQALGFIFPSLCEGFGLPILEAMAFGCPVVLSRATSFPEVAGEAGIYFDPYSASSIRQAVEALQAPENRMNKIEAGRRRVEAYRWEESALKLARFYEELI